MEYTSAQQVIIDQVNHYDVGYGIVLDNTIKNMVSQPDCPQEALTTLFKKSMNAYGMFGYNEGQTIVLEHPNCPVSILTNILQDYVDKNRAKKRIIGTYEFYDSKARNSNAPMTLRLSYWLSKRNMKKEHSLSYTTHTSQSAVVSFKDWIGR